ncbi:protein of unknown function [Pseudomonas sp. JV551A1]|nr:protein of unknown function [Pseudomonas sp. JV551A1]
MNPGRNGGAKRDRTADLLHAMQALSQLSYSPETKGSSVIDEPLKPCKTQEKWRPLGDSNPCYRRERAVS